jgi:hypothetical protein
MTIQEEFWKWFVQHEVELFGFKADREAERERIFDQLVTELGKVHPDLTFEFGPNATVREFVISAGGIKSAFPAVVSLANAAPSLMRWQVTAFRLRRTLSVVELGSKRVDPKEVEFSVLDNGELAGLYLYIPGFQESDTDLRQIGYLLLDDALGEYDVETRLGLIKMLSPQAFTDFERYALAKLPGHFDKLVSRFERRSGTPS